MTPVIGLRAHMDNPGWSYLQIPNYTFEDPFSKYDDIHRFWVDICLGVTIQLITALWRLVRGTVYKMRRPVPGEEKGQDATLLEVTFSS